MKKLSYIKALNTIAAVLLGLSMLLKFDWAYILAYVALGLIVVTLLSDMLTRWLATGWMWIGETLGNINGKIILGAIFFLMLTPIALLYRLTSNDKLQLKRRQDKSYFVERNHTFEGKDLEKMW